MCVWQSQAPAGTSKFTGVDGCDAVARAVRLRMVAPAAIETSRILRLGCPLFRWSRCVGAHHGRGVASRACGKERDDRAHQRTGGQEIQPGLETAGGILDPADDEGAEIDTEVTC